QNIDLRDAKTVLSDSGTAIMGSASASGSNRAHEAISKALDSPLLNDNKIKGSKNVLLLIVSGAQEITIDEIGEINDYIQAEAGHSANIIMGVGEDESKEDAITITVIATGFDIEQQNQISNTENKKIIHTLEEEQKAVQELSPKSGMTAVDLPLSRRPKEDNPQRPVRYTLFDQVEEPKSRFLGYVALTEEIKNMEVSYEQIIPESYEEDTLANLEDLNVDDFIIVTPQQQESSETIVESTDEKGDDGDILMFDLEAPSVPQENPASKSREVSTQTKPEVKDSSVKRYTLEIEDEKDESPRATFVEEEETDRFLQFKTMKKPAVEPQEDEEDGEIDPMNAPISRVLRARTEERKRSLKAF